MGGRTGWRVERRYREVNTMEPVEPSDQAKDCGHLVMPSAIVGLVQAGVKTTASSCMLPWTCNRQAGASRGPGRGLKW